MAHLSIVSPIYNAQHILPELILRLENSLKEITLDFEIILVDDSSPDHSWDVIKELSKNKKYIKGIQLSRNFGQHYAITCGIDHSNGDWVVVMDCDLQDQPEEIPKLYRKALEGYDIVLARRYSRKDNFLKKTFSKLFYKTLGYLTGTEQDETVANFGIYHKKVISSIISMRESIRFFPSMVKWVGYKSTKLSVNHSKREVGKSGYSFNKLIKLAIDIVLAYSDKPLMIVIKIGLIISLISLIFSLIIIIRWVNGEIIELGYTSLIISIWLLSGFIISTVGVTGLYIGKIFEGIKNRPIYIIKNKTNDSKDRVG
ncbi:MAG: dolichol-phosphate mannosyltransferase [Polaribacter sp.]|jgi:dolichol-phosphate mannosyltransferase|tara:strand:+ start:4199 stop:5140 length:942 start_codon:yes stop_codon:yes gene_type:complete